MKDIEIAKVLYLAKNHKYEVACASFDLVDHIFKVEVPKNVKGRKPAVQAMSLIAENQIQYGYEKEHTVADSDEE